MNLSAVEQIAQKAFQKGKSLIQKGMYTQAIQALRQGATQFQLLQKWTDYTQSLVQIILCYIHLSDFETALATARQLLAFLKNNDIHEEEKSWVFAYAGLGAALFYKGNFSEALAIQKTALEKGLQIATDDGDTLSSLHNNLGNTYIYKNRYNEALRHLHQALELRLKMPNIPPTSLANTYNNLGNCYGYKGDYQKALEHYQISLKIRQQHLPENHIHIAESYHNLGWCYVQIRDYDVALLHNQKTLAIRLKVLTPKHSDIAHSYNTIGRILGDQGKMEEALTYHQKSLKIWSEDYFLSAIVYHNLAWTYHRLGQYAAAIEYGQKTLQSTIRAHGEHHWDVVKTYGALSKYYLDAGHLDEAFQHAQKAVNTITTIPKQQSHPLEIQAHTYLGIAYRHQHNYPHALNHFQRAIEAAISSEHKTNGQTISLDDIVEPTYFISALAEKGNTYYHIYQHLSQDVEDLAQAATAYQWACQVMDKLRGQYRAIGSKLDAGKRLFNLFKLALETSIQWYEVQPTPTLLQAIFNLFEKSKSFVLLSNLKETQAKITANIPPKLLDEERALQIEHQYLQKKIREETNKSSEKDEAYLLELQTQLFDIHQKQEQLIAQLEKDFPQYHQLKYQTDPIFLKNVQSQLAEQAALIEYFTTESQVFIILITRQDISLKRLHLSDILEDYTLSELIDDFQIALDSPIRQDLYIEVAYELYQLLLSPISSALNGKTNLLIIPDGILSQIPFEALLTDMPATLDTPYKDLPYLLLTYHIHYHYSATLWLHIQQRKHRQHSPYPKRFAGFAPVVYNGNLAPQVRASLPYFKKAITPLTLRGEDYAALPYSELEIQQISELLAPLQFETLLYLREKATAHFFKKAINGASLQFVHIAAHGVYNRQHPEFSGIVFSPETREHSSTPKAINSLSKVPNTDKNTVQYKGSMLYISDTYTLDLSGIDLVVLSCCESGLGKMAKGEGMLAMNRGFLYGGANHVIYTLFKVYDQASCELTQTFYQYVLGELSYCEALQAAKKAMLLHRYPPKAWAGYVLLG